MIRFIPQPICAEKVGRKGRGQDFDIRSPRPSPKEFWTLGEKDSLSPDKCMMAAVALFVVCWMSDRSACLGTVIVLLLLILDAWFQVHTERPMELFDIMSPSFGAVDLHQKRSLAPR